MRHITTDIATRRKDWRWAFLDILGRTCCVSRACAAAGVGRRTAYAHRSKFPKFRAKWDEALAVGVELLEVHARTRALDPKDPASASLLMFLLKAHRPRKYRDNGHKIPLPVKEDGSPLNPAALDALSDEDLEHLERIAAKLFGRGETQA